MFVPGKPFQPSLMFVGEARDKHSTLLRTFINITNLKGFIRLGPGGVIVIKKLSPSFANFRNKLECLSLASLSSLV